MSIISFKSVGKTVTDTQTAISSSLIPLGIRTPLKLGTRGEGIFGMHFLMRDQIHDNLRNLVLTNHGERLCMHDFGANLRPLTTELVNLADFDSEAVNRIRAAVIKYMPYVSLKEYTSKIDQFNNQHTGKLILMITYDVPALNIVNRALEIVLNVI